MVQFQDRDSDIAEKVRRERREAAAQIVVGAIYEHCDGDGDIEVTEFHQPTEQVYWQKPGRPHPYDRFRTLDVVDFVAVYRLKSV